MSHQKTDPEAIRASVRRHYARVAESATKESCCGGASPLYTAQELDAVPGEAAAASAGCGNPVALASLKPGETVLDLGSGGGIDVFLAARQVGPGGFVYGLDMTDEMLALARRNAEKLGAKNVSFLKGDLEAIPLPDRSVDVIISNCVINLTPDKSRALKEAFRVLRPGGRLAVSDVVIDPDLSGLPIEEERIRSMLGWSGCLGGALTSDQYRELLAQAGFEQIDVEVKHRYSFQEASCCGPTPAGGLSRADLDAIAHRFTSSSITAVRPRA